MTCIVGLITKNDVYIGVDSATSDSNHHSQVVNTKKLIVKNDMLIGYTTSWRMGNLLEHEFKPPTISQSVDPEQYMVVKFISALRKCFKEAGFSKIENNQEKGGALLVAIKRSNQLFKIQSDFSVVTPESYASVGSGANYALASLKTTEDLKLSPTKRLRLALEAAAYFDYGVRPPFQITSFKTKL